QGNLPAQFLHSGRIGAVPPDLALWQCGTDRLLSGAFRHWPWRDRAGAQCPVHATGADHPADRGRHGGARADRLGPDQVLLPPSRARHGSVDQRLLSGSGHFARHRRLYRQRRRQHADGLRRNRGNGPDRRCHRRASGNANRQTHGPKAVWRI
ncbi:hypothetical protein KXX12_008854, partial [Aspergillus fumigatus]